MLRKWWALVIVFRGGYPCGGRGRGRTTHSAQPTCICVYLCIVYYTCFFMYTYVFYLVCFFICLYTGPAPLAFPLMGAGWSEIAAGQAREACVSLGFWA